MITTIDYCQWGQAFNTHLDHNLGRWFQLDEINSVIQKLKLRAAKLLAPAIFKILFIYFCALGLHLAVRAFSSCTRWVSSPWGAWASCCCGFSCLRAQTLSLGSTSCGMGFVAPRQVESSQTSGLSTTGPPGKFSLPPVWRMVAESKLKGTWLWAQVRTDPWSRPQVLPPWPGRL